MPITLSGSVVSVTSAWLNTTIVSGSASSVTVSAAIPAGAVGRHVWITDGSAKHDVRKIASVSGMTMTFDHPLRSVPASGDGLRVAYTWVDLGDAGVGIVRNGRNLYSPHTISLGQGSYVAQENMNLTIGSSGSVTRPLTVTHEDCMWQMGYLNEFDSAVSGCSLRVHNGNGTSNNWRKSAGEPKGGHFLAYASLISCGINSSNSYPTFWYLVNADDPDHMTHLIDTVFSEFEGGFRISGPNYSRIRNVVFRECRGSVPNARLGCFTTVGDLFEVDGISIESCDQGFYWGTAAGFGGTTTITGLSTSNTLTDYWLRTGQSNQTLTLIDDRLPDTPSAFGISPANASCRVVRKSQISLVGVDNANAPVADYRFLLTGGGEEPDFALTADPAGNIAQFGREWQRRDGQNTLLEDVRNQVGYFGRYGFVRGLAPIDIRSPGSRSLTFIPDPAITLDEPTAASLTGISLDFTNQTVDVSGSGSASNVGHRHHYEAIEFANLSAAEILSFDGETLTVLDGSTLTSSQSITGSYRVVSGGRLIGAGTRTRNATIEVASGGVLEDPSNDLMGPVTVRSGAVFEVSLGTSSSKDCRDMVFEAGSIILHSGSGTLTVVLNPGAQLPNVDPSSTGTVVFDQTQIVQVTAPQLVDGTRVLLRDTTNGVTLDNSVVSGGGGYVFNHTFNGPIDVEITMCQVDGLTAMKPERREAPLGADGVQFNLIQEVDDDYVAIGVDGSTVSELVADFANVQIDLSDGDGTFNVDRAYSWFRWLCTTQMGIAVYNPFALIQSPDRANIIVDGPLQLENVGANPVTITGGIWKRLDGQPFIAATSNTIHWIPDDRVIIAPIDQDLFDRIDKNTRQPHISLSL